MVSRLEGGSAGGYRRVPLLLLAVSASVLIMTGAGASPAAGTEGVFGGSLSAMSPGPGATGAVAWGENRQGQLGNGTTSSSDVPVPVDELSSGVTAVSGGSESSVALRSDGTVVAWGENSFGQLGNGTTTGSDVPVAVSGLSGVTAISAGNWHGLALLSNGTVMAWGDNAFGQLGNGITTNSDVPVAVSGLSGVTAVSAGTNYSMALLSNGTVMAWGLNEFGVLGNGTTTRSSVPEAVGGLTEVTAIAAGDGTSTALLKNGTVMDWGYGSFGELGNGTTTSSKVPVAVSDLSGVTAIGVGMALLSNGTVVDWGLGSNGRLGTGNDAGPESCEGAPCSKVPVAVTGLSGVTAIVAGFEHRLALLNDGTVRGWGANGVGQLGNGTETGSNVPVAVSGLTGITAIGAGQYHSLAAGGPPAPFPTVTRVEPNSGPPSGGTSVTITGTNFTGATAVRFGQTAASFKVESETEITASSPAGTGTVDVSVTTPEGSSPTGAADRFSYGPTVTSVTPDEGPATGGTSVTISGTNFSEATAVKFGPNNAATFTVNSATSITAVSPAGSPNRVDVTVASPGGTSPLTIADVFAYLVPSPPTVTRVEPNRGPAAGGTSVTLTGTNFTAVSAVQFGSTDATDYTVNSATSITAVSPAFSGGSATVDITVTNPAGTSPITTNSTPFSESDLFLYEPAVTHIEPSSGTTAGGTTLTITGIAFSSTFKRGTPPACWICAVKFGSTNATSFEVRSENTIKAVSPAGAGTVDVTAESIAGPSPTGPADEFRYLPVPNAPTVLTAAASAITKSTATLNASVNPEGSEVDECKFEYGTTPSYGSSAPCTPAPGSGSSPVAVSAGVTGLSQHTTYHFRISATNAGGTSKGSDQTLSTLPVQHSVPHYYKSSYPMGLIAEGEKLPVLSWGTLTLTPEPPSKAGPTSCEDSTGGFVENPSGGGAGIGQTQNYSSWNCANAGCPAGAVEFPAGSGEFVEKEFIVFASGESYARQSLPWTSELFEANERIRSESKGILMELACVAAKTAQSLPVADPDQPQLLTVPTVCFTTPTNVQAPLTENGGSFGPNQSKLIYDKESGRLLCKGPGANEDEEISFEGATSGTLKAMGYKGSEIIIAK